MLLSDLHPHDQLLMIGLGVGYLAVCAACAALTPGKTFEERWLMWICLLSVPGYYTIIGLGYLLRHQ